MEGSLGGWAGRGARRRGVAADTACHDSVVGAPRTLRARARGAGHRRDPRKRGRPATRPGFRSRPGSVILGGRWGSDRREGFTINRRRLAALAGLAIAIAACGYSGPSAAALLQKAKATFDQTTSFHLQLSSQDTPGTGLELTAAEGDALRPDGFTGTLTIEEAGLPLAVKVVSTGGGFYVELPFSDDFTKANPAQYGFADPGQLLNPSTGVSTLLTAAENPSIGSSTRYNGELLQQVDATLPGTEVASLLVDAQPSQKVTAVFSIDTSTYQVREVDLTGPLFEAGHQSTFHVVLDNYGENVSITPPATP